MNKPEASYDHRPLMATVNDEIDRLHGSLDLPDSEFFCECGHVACAERVKLSRQEFAALRADARPLRVAAHATRASSAPTIQEVGDRLEC